MRESRSSFILKLSISINRGTPLPQVIEMLRINVNTDWQIAINLVTNACGTVQASKRKPINAASRASGSWQTGKKIICSRCFPVCLRLQFRCICPVPVLLVLDFFKICAKLYQTNKCVCLIQFVRERDIECPQRWKMSPGKPV